MPPFSRLVERILIGRGSLTSRSPSPCPHPLGPAQPTSQIGVGSLRHLSGSLPARRRSSSRAPLGAPIRTAPPSRFRDDRPHPAVAHRPRSQNSGGGRGLSARDVLPSLP